MLYFTTELDSQILQDLSSSTEVFRISDPSSPSQSTYWYRLTPRTYAYIRGQLFKAQAAVEAGKLAFSEWETYDQKFRIIREYAKAHLSEAEVREAITQVVSLPLWPHDDWDNAIKMGGDFAPTQWKSKHVLVT